MSKLTLKNIYITSDLHIGSEVIAQTRGFKDWEEAWQDYKYKHNYLIKDNLQNVIIAGDICSNRKYQPLLKELKGSLHFVLGNHDLGFDYSEYGISYPMLICTKTKIIVTHIPIHPDYFQGSKTNYLNYHGHTHYDLIKYSDEKVDLRYVCVCLDHYKNTPIYI